MKKTFLAFGCLLMSLGALADDVQTVTIGGTTVNKTVTQITFSGDDVILHFSDNSTQTADILSMNMESPLIRALTCARISKGS